MGNEQGVEARRSKKEPAFCCGQQPRKQPLEEASPNVMNLGRPVHSRFNRNFSSSSNKDEPTQMEETGSTYYKDKDMTIFRKPQNSLENTIFNQTGSTDNKGLVREEGATKNRQENPLRPITQQTQNKKGGFASFKKSGYGAYNTQNNFGSFNGYGLHTTKFKENKELDQKNMRPTPIVDYAVEKELKESRLVKKPVGPFVGQGKYSGRVEEFNNNKKIVEFLSENNVRQAEFKFYDTQDNSSLLNNSTIGIAKKRYGVQQMNEEEQSTSNIKAGNLSRLQEPIELMYQIDGRVILATFILLLGIVILVLGATVFYSETNFFICMIIALVLYLGYLIMTFLFNDVFEYLYNVRSFEDFEKDYKLLRETDGEFALHLHLNTHSKFVKECYLLSKENEYMRIRDVQNENRQVALSDLKDKMTSYVFVKYKTKTSFYDPDSQLNTVQYFDEFLEEHKDSFAKAHAKKDIKSKSDKKSRYREEKEKKNNEHSEELFHQNVSRIDFNYELNQIPGMTSKPEFEFTACYMKEDDSGCVLTLFVIFTLFGLSLPFLCIFQAYAKRYRVNILNRFRVE